MNKQMNTDFAAARKACPASMLREETSSFTECSGRADNSAMKICYWRISRCLLAGSLCGILSACGHQAAPRSLVKLEAQRVQLTETAKRMTLTGEIRAQVESDLAFRVGGRITERLVDVGDHVSS